MPYYQTIVYSPGIQAGDVLPGGVNEIIAALAASDAAFEVVPDICLLSAEGDPAMRRWSAATDLRIAGLPRRAVKWLFHAAGQTLPETAQVLDPKTTTPDEITRGLLAGRGDDKCPAPADNTHAAKPSEALTVVLYEGHGARAMTPPRRAELILAAVAAGYRVVRPARGEGLPSADTSAVAVVGDFKARQAPEDLPGGEGVVCIDASGLCGCGTIDAVDEIAAAMGLPKPGEWMPWFPVIDYDRCADCKQCANFCLFGVFSTDDGGVRVSNPASCKTNCPACARMCPHAAIIFPHYPTGPINGQEATEQPGGGDAATSLKEALQGDVYQVLRSRQGGAVSFAAAKAAIGAGNHGPAGLVGLARLEKVAEQLEIPPQVLMSLSVSAAPAGAACNCECDADAAGDIDRRPADCQCDCSAERGGGLLDRYSSEGDADRETFGDIVQCDRQYQ